MSSYSEMKSDATGLAGGCLLSFIVLWITTFYPSFIISIALQRIFFGIDSEADGTYLLGFVAMIVGTFVIVGLAAARQYFIVLMLYIVTAWPFLYIVNHWCHAEDSAMYPVPLDWWPLW